MICAHCKERGVNVAHVKACSNVEQQIRSIGAPRPDDKFDSPKANIWDEGPTEGVYFHDGWYFKVLQSSTKNWYAKVWESPLGDGEYVWSYVGRAPLYNIKPDERVNADQAAAFGWKNHRCVFCGRNLSDEREGRSVEVGYGPICAEKNNLPWGEVA